MMIHLIKQDWCNSYEGNDSIIIGVYDSFEKAQNKLKECYNEDIEWLTKDHEFELSDLEENEIDDRHSYVQASNAEYWSSNEIQSYELQ